MLAAFCLKKRVIRPSWHWFETITSCFDKKWIYSKHLREPKDHTQPLGSALRNGSSEVLTKIFKL